MKAHRLAGRSRARAWSRGPRRGHLFGFVRLRLTARGLRPLAASIRVVTARYFAYGSNMALSRMRARAASAHFEGAARLPGFRLACDKLGADGSGKANLRVDASAEVWGALYTIETGDLARLDAHEGGYDRVTVEVCWRDAIVAAHTYRSTRTTRDPTPFAWYKRLVVEGAREHGLPADWILALEAWPEREGC